MKKIVCEMCGSNDFRKQEGEYICQHCGTRYSTEEAQKLLIEYDETKQIEKLLVVARRAKAENNYEDAYQRYSQVQDKSPENWEAVFYTAYCKAMDCTIGQIKLATSSMEKHMETITQVLLNIKEIEERQNAINSILLDTKLMCEFYRLVSREEYKKRGGASSSLESRQRYVDEIKEVGILYGTCGIYIGGVDGESGSKHTDLVVDIFKSAIDCFSEVSPLTTDGLQGTADMIGEKIKKYDSSYQTPSLQRKSAIFGTTNAAPSSSGGCYIATCVYGSYDCPEVWVLRRFRDEALSHCLLGRMFISTYYSISPHVVKRFGSYSLFSKCWKPILDQVVKNLKKNGFSDSTYEDQ